jgi:hypothetical protein
VIIEKNEIIAAIAKRRGDIAITPGKQSNASHDAYGKIAKIAKT